MKIRKTRTDATGAALDAAAMYTPLIPHSRGEAVYNDDTQLPGSHEAVTEAPDRWLPVDMDSTEKLRRRLEALYAPPPSQPQPAAPPIIPPDRQAVATETFWASSGAFIRKGTILPDDAEVVQAHRQYFHRPAQPLEAA